MGFFNVLAKCCPLIFQSNHRLGICSLNMLVNNRHSSYIIVCCLSYPNETQAHNPLTSIPAPFKSSSIISNFLLHVLCGSPVGSRERTTFWLCNLQAFSTCALSSTSFPHLLTNWLCFLFRSSPVLICHHLTPILHRQQLQNVCILFIIILVSMFLHYSPCFWSIQQY